MVYNDGRLVNWNDIRGIFLYHNRNEKNNNYAFRLLNDAYLSTNT